MTVTSMVVANVQGSTTAPFWSNGASQVTVEFTSNDSGGYNVRGLDAQNQEVFSGNLLTSQKDRFIAAISAGTAGTLVSNDNMAIADAVIITGKDPGPGQGPKLVYEVPLPLS